MNITAYSVVIIKMKTNPTATLDIKAKMKFPVKEILLSEERTRTYDDFFNLIQGRIFWLLKVTICSPHQSTSVPHWMMLSPAKGSCSSIDFTQRVPISHPHLLETVLKPWGGGKWCIQYNVNENGPRTKIKVNKSEPWNNALFFIEAHHSQLAGQELEAKVHLHRVRSVQAVRAVRPSQEYVQQKSWEIKMAMYGTRSGFVYRGVN